MRKLEYILGAVIAAGADTLITCGGLQSNHCRATAIVAAQLGLKAHLILRGTEGESDLDGNLLLDHLAGAEVSIYPPNVYFKQLKGLFDHWEEAYRQKGRSPWSIPTGASDEIGIWGYIDAAYELGEQIAALGLEPDCIVCATGSGGTQAGLSLGMRMQESSIPVLGMAVCDSERYFERKATKDLSLWQERYGEYTGFRDGYTSSVKINTCDKYIGPGYGLAYPEMLECIKWVARTEGVILDPCYTGKAFYGMIEEIKSGQLKGMKDIVFVHTGGVFGLFPYRAQL